MSPPTLTKGSGVQQCSLPWPPCIIITYPLLTALARDSHVPGLAAPEAWRPGAQAQRRAAHGAIDTGAVVPAVGLEGLSIGVAHAIQDTAHTDHFCKHRWQTCQSSRYGLRVKLLLCSFPLLKMPCQEVTQVRQENLAHISAGCTPRTKRGSCEEMGHIRQKERENTVLHDIRRQSLKTLLDVGWESLAP